MTLDQLKQALDKSIEAAAATAEADKSVGLDSFSSGYDVGYLAALEDVAKLISDQP